MGLDMYLDRMVRVDGVSAKQILMIDSYLDYQKEKRDCSLKDWCGIDENDLPAKETIEKYKSMGSFIEEVGYWRKQNAIHNWFVENVQGGVDDCGTYEVTEEQIDKLLSKCEFVLKNPEKAGEILPTRGGFFFGGLEYGHWYFQGLKETVDILVKVLDETDFENMVIVYTSSW